MKDDAPSVLPGVLAPIATMVAALKAEAVRIGRPEVTFVLVAITSGPEGVGVVEKTGGGDCFCPRYLAFMAQAVLMIDPKPGGAAPQAVH